MSILRSQDFLVTTHVGDVSRSIVWHGDKPCELDLPHGWVLERAKTRGNLRIRNSSLSPFQAQLDDSVEFAIPEPGRRQLLDLPDAGQARLKRPLGVEITQMKSIDPVYILRHTMAPHYTGFFPKQLMMFYGERYYLVRYRPVPPAYKITNGAHELFRYAKTDHGYSLVARSPGLKLKTAKEKKNLPIGVTYELSENAFFSATIISGVHWWRFRMVPSPDSAKPVETAETEDDIREELRFKHSALMFLILFTVLWGTMYRQSLQTKPPPKIVAAVEIKQPKIIPPAKEELKPPPPPPPPEPPKVVEEKPKPIPPKPEKKPVKKIAKLKPKAKPKPVRVAAHEPPPPAPVKAAKVEPPPPTPAQIHAAETAAMKQDLLKKLNFISTSSKRSVADTNYDQQKDATRFTNTPTVGGDVSKTTSLDKLVKDAPGNGQIKTNSSRTVSSTVDFGPTKGKGLNDVQGKVSLNDIYSSNGAVGSSLGGPSISITGPGELSEGELEKALAKFIQRFNFCYEKALLSDSSLGGKIQMQWTITTGGKGQNPKVVSSQLNNPDLHGCISKVLKEIPFPKPKNGNVVVKKVFAFSSSTL